MQAAQRLPAKFAADGLATKSGMAVMAAAAVVCAVEAVAFWWRRRWWFSRRRVSWQWIQGGGAAFHGGGSEAVVFCVHRGGFRRAGSTAAARWGSPRLSPATSPPASLSPAVLRRLLRIPVLLWLSASLLPRDLDLLRAAKNLPLSSVVSSPLARSLLRIPVSLLVRSEMKQAPDRAPVFFNATNAAVQSQSLPAQGLIFHGVSFSIRHCAQCSGGQ